MIFFLPAVHLYFFLGVSAHDSFFTQNSFCKIFIEIEIEIGKTTHANPFRCQVVGLSLSENLLTFLQI